MDFSIWIDADSCPTLVRDYLLELSSKSKLHISLVANKLIPTLNQNELVSFYVCDSSKDSADNYIFSNVQKDDIVITRDIVFAQRLVEKSICVMNDRGTLFTKENISERINERNLSLACSQLGLKTGYSKNKYGTKELSAFKKCMTNQLQIRNIN